jgi:large subunit ribosomal protein L3
MKMSSAFGLLGKKIGMTQVFNPDGSRVGATAIEVGPCVVVQKRTEEKEGYTAVQLGFIDKPERKVNRAEMGHFAKAGVKPKRVLREFRLAADAAAGIEVGQELKADMFKVGDRVDVVGTSIGKGFAGVFKTYHFHGANDTHGAHEVFRHGGSLGTNMTPGRVFKGRKMPGHHSAGRITVLSVEVVRVFAEDNLIFVRGPVPGSRNSVVELKPAIKGKR